MAQQSDEALVLAYLKSGNEVLFGLLYKRYHQKVYHHCLSYTKNEELARDLSQDIFLKIHDKISRFQHKSSFSTWLFQITRNHCLDFLKSAGYRLQSNEEPPPERDEIPDSELFQIKAERLKIILDEVSPEIRELLMMKYAFDWQIDEIAEKLDSTEGAIKMKLKRAKEKVLDIYEKKYLSFPSYIL